MSVRDYRMDIGIDILLEMKKNKEFPIANRYMLADRMMEYFYQMGFEDKIFEDGYTWQPDAEYWRCNLSGINGYEGLQDILRRKKGLFFCFLHSGSGFEGVWDFANKERFVSEMERNHGEVNTRIETYNGKTQDAMEKWNNVSLPYGQPIPALADIS